MRIRNILILLACAVVIAFIWYSPILFKGYHPDLINDQLVLARNLAESGKFTLYNNHGVVISSDMAREFGEESSIGNKLTARLYAAIFKYFGALGLEEIALVSVILNSLALFVFSLVVLYLFNIQIAAVFSFIYALLPFQWRNVYFLGNYEFAALFLLFFFLFFFFGIFGEKTKFKIFSFTFSGFFLSLAALSKEAFLIMFPIIFLFLFFSNFNKSIFWKENFIKKILPFFAPVIIIFAFFYFPAFFSGKNIYRSQLFSERPKDSFDWSLAGHLYPDYYTYRYNREKFLEDAKRRNEGFIKSVYFKKAAGNVGEGINILERLIIGTTLFFSHAARFMSLEESGGPFIFILILMGCAYLYKKNEKENILLKFFLYWIIGTLFILSFIALAGRTHLMDFSFAVALFISLGIFYVAEVFASVILFPPALSWFQRGERKWEFKTLLKLFRILDFRFRGNDKKSNLKIIFFTIAVFTFYHLFLVSRHEWGKAYNGNMLRIQAFASEIEEMNIKEREVIMTGLRHDENLMLNFLVNKPLIVFRPETLENLIKEKKFTDATHEFNIKYVLGYTPEISENIKKEGDIEIISIDESSYKIPTTSFFKMWLLGIFR